MDYDPALCNPDDKEDCDNYEEQKAMDEVLSGKPNKGLPHTSRALGLNELGMAAENRYLANEDAYLPIAKAAVADQFSSGAAVEVFYQNIGGQKRKNLFLRTAAFYYVLIKYGDWVVTAPDCNPIIDYLTNSYKIVGLFALIESLSDETHEDFHAWLGNKANISFPINDYGELNDLHAKYKATCGSIRRCVNFFSRLSPNRQEELCKSIRIDNEPIQDIKKLAQFLYDTRSKFVHEAELVLNMSGSTIHLGHKKPNLHGAQDAHDAVEL
ncbi:hypothetical protein [Candidatus Thiodictyon syntrophicum]|jgi:hypothetical protein|uniref:hypothetical protein n=1 Tax=Candidatus Thiodictyon syntrophicum TaxID=1166950 RepID=UPI0012FDC199|nr:hypothetical protein [Candidatus Thiodictyon syntrophicum]